MMYQRDMGGCAFVLAEQAEQEFDDGREEGIDPEEEDRQQGGHDQHHDSGGDGFLAGRPDDLGGLGTDLIDEFAGGSLCHNRQPFVRKQVEKRGPRTFRWTSSQRLTSQQVI